MTRSPKKHRPKDIKKHNEELRKKRREDHFQKKRFLVMEYRAEGRSIRWIADRIMMSVGFVHKWCDRLDEQIKARKKALRKGTKNTVYPQGCEIKEAIRSASRAPKCPHRKITKEHRDIIIEVRKGRFTKKMGAQKIVAFCDLEISHQSVHRILREEGLTRPYRKRKQRSFDPFRRGHPNELWQIDYKEFCKGVYMLSVKDDYSSTILAADVRSTCRTEDVTDILEKTIKLFGRPDQILSDHGTQFTSRDFETWCSGKEIEHIMGRVRKPTTQGKVERWHGTVLEEAELPPKGSSVEEYRKAVLEFMEFYNNHRPHHGIGLQIPIITYAGGLILNDIISDDGVHEVS